MTDLSTERILVFRVGHLGDTVLALPAFWAVRRHCPSSHIALLTNTDHKNPDYISPADVLPPAGLFDEFIDYPTNAHRFSQIQELIKLASRLRKKRFGAVLYLMPRTRTDSQIRRDRAFFSLAGIRDVRGVEFLKDQRLVYPVGFPTSKVELESDFLLDMLGEMGIRADKIETDLLLTGDEISSGQEWLAQSAVNTRQPLVAVAIGAKLDFKRWGDDKYLQTVSELIESINCYPILFGGPEDRESGDRLIKAWGTGVNAAGLLSVRESAAVLGKCNLYLGNDTGTMHLAAAVGIPCVAIFSAMEWIDRWNPLGNGHRIFRTNSLCEGCLHLHDKDLDHTCMDAIGADEVLAASLEILSKS